MIEYATQNNARKEAKMTKYIHYEKRYSAGVLISDNLDETRQGYTLGLEITCSDFDDVLKIMCASQNIPIDISNGIATNINLSGFKNEFMRCVGVAFPNKEYCIREIYEDHVVWYERKIHPKL